MLVRVAFTEGLLAGALPVLGQELDSFYEDVLVTLTHECSDTFPDLKERIDESILGYVKANHTALSADYVERIREAPSSGKTFTREQCIGMAALPQVSMSALFDQAAKERLEAEEARAEFERGSSSSTDE
ncbi:hypothetical protein ACFW0P_16760 [Lysobacter soli]|uniref:hypothetical protein n=1 Tax=Lysobacter soli TaxID=453783 RepID=UPI00369DCDEF